MNRSAVLPALSMPLFAASTDAHPSRVSKVRVLLALDGQHVPQELQRVALKYCLQWTRRLDILLINPPKAPTFLLGGLLLRLEHSGIDYRLDSREGEFGNEVVRYLQRFPGIGLVIVNAMPAVENFIDLYRPVLADTSVRFISLAEPERLLVLNSKP